MAYNACYYDDDLDPATDCVNGDPTFGLPRNANEYERERSERKEVRG
jgi:hypothetical protein